MSSLAYEILDYAMYAAVGAVEHSVDSLDDIATDVLPVNIEDGLKQSYLDFAKSVIFNRTLCSWPGSDENWGITPNSYLWTQFEESLPFLSAATAQGSNNTSSNELLLSGGRGLRSPPASIQLIPPPMHRDTVDNLTVTRNKHKHRKLPDLIPETLKAPIGGKMQERKSERLLTNTAQNFGLALKDAECLPEARSARTVNAYGMIRTPPTGGAQKA